LGISVPVPNWLEIHNEGFMSTYEFHDKIKKISRGTGLTLLEASNPGREYEAYETSKEGDRRVEKTHLHYYLNSQIQGKIPLETFVRAHEQTEILIRTDLLDKYDIFSKRLNDIGFPSELLPPAKEFHLLGHVGGLAALILMGVRVVDMSNSGWLAFYEQTVDLVGEPEFKEAVRLYKRNQKVTSLS
jgi:hypothetical protein